MGLQTEGEELHFTGIPSFSPEQFRYVENADPMKAKHLDKGLEQLMDDTVDTIGPDDDLSDALLRMDEKRLFNMPVVFNKRFAFCKDS